MFENIALTGDSLNALILIVLLGIYKKLGAIMVVVENHETRIHDIEGAIS